MGKVREIRREFLCECKALCWKCSKHLEQFVIYLCCNTSWDSFPIKHLVSYTLIFSETYSGRLAKLLEKMGLSIII